MTKISSPSFDEWQNQTTRIEIGGHQIATWTADDGSIEKPWLLLIHGYPTSSWDWTFSWAQLSENFRLAALDMVGFGLSDKPVNHQYSIFEQADLQEAFLEHLGVGEAHLLVHDYGNTVGQELLARQHDHALSFAIKSLCFLNGGLFPEQHRARLLQKFGLTPLGPILGMLLSRDRLRKSFDEIFGPNTKASNEEIDMHWAMISANNGDRVLHKLLQYIPERKAHRERWVGAIKNAVIPTRLIDGGADPVSGKHLYDYYLTMVDKADAILLPDIGHYPHTESTQEVLDAFFDFHRNAGTIT